MNLSKLQDRVKDRKAWHTAVSGVTYSWTHVATEQQQQQICKKSFLSSQFFLINVHVIPLLPGHTIRFYFSESMNLCGAILLSLGL